MARSNSKNPQTQSLKSGTRLSLPSKKSKRKTVSKPQFTAGSGGLASSRKLNLKRVIPLVVAVALAGGYLVFQGFAGTYSVCKNALSSDQNSTYNQQCIVDSEEASVIRLYQTVLNTTPEQKDVQFWSEKLLNNSLTLNDAARQFIESGDFKKAHGSLTNEQFIGLMYSQGLGRAPDAATSSYWQGRLASGASSRQSMVTSLIQSDEMKNRLSAQVARVLAISTFSPLDSSKRAVTDARSRVVLTSPAGEQCTIIVAATETWQKTTKKGIVDVSASDQGPEGGCKQYKLTKLTTQYNLRESGSTKVSAQNSASSSDVDERTEFESFQVTITKPNQVMRLDGAVVELKDEASSRCVEYSADLRGNILAPSTMTQTASRKC